MARSGSGRRRKKGFSSWGVVAAGVVLGSAALALFVFYGWYQVNDVRPPERPAVVAPPLPDKPAVDIPVADMPATAEPHDKFPLLAIVIDDMGRDTKALEALFDVGVPINVAVLPHLRHSRQTAIEANKRGWDVLLHLPMEPSSDVNDPGRGALWTGMTPEEVRSQLALDLETVPFAGGVNNHMGSKFTEDEPLMKEVIKDLKKRRLFFLDSRTSAKTVGGRLAVEMGVPSLDRSVFLDNVRDVGYVKDRVAEAVRLARKNGASVAIGHPYPETISALKQTLSGINNREARIVRLSELLKAREAKRGAARR